MASPIALTHYRIGDTNPANPLATDEECAQALLDNGGDTYLAAAAVVETKLMQLALLPIRTIRNGVTTEYANPAQYWRLLIQQLRLQASLKAAGVYAGGVWCADKVSNARDRSVVQPFVTKDLHIPAVPRALVEEDRD